MIGLRRLVVRLLNLLLLQLLLLLLLKVGELARLGHLYDVLIGDDAETWLCDRMEDKFMIDTTVRTNASASSGSHRLSRVLRRRRLANIFIRQGRLGTRISH